MMEEAGRADAVVRARAEMASLYIILNVSNYERNGLVKFIGKDCLFVSARNASAVP
jgi:hypothetical protein